MICHLLAIKYHQNLFFFLQQEGDRRMKLQNMVKFPLTGLDMTPHVVKRSQSSWSLPSHWSPWRRPYGLGRDPEDYIYDLYAVCNHHGTMQGGHYTGLQCERLRVCAGESFRRVCLWQGDLTLEPHFPSSRQCANCEGSFHPLDLCPRANKRTFFLLFLSGVVQ